jgi:UDP-glucose 4-epimerase
MTEHILVTGGAGYIGGAAVRLLLQHNYQVTVLDNLSRGHRSSPADGVPLIVGDAGDRECLSGIFSANRFDERRLRKSANPCCSPRNIFRIIPARR